MSDRKLPTNGKLPPDLKLLAQVCSTPTAPFVEGWVEAFVRRFARARRIDLQRDRHGNLLLSLGRPRAGQRRLVLSAHMDHPGFVADAMLGPGRLRAHFRGGVLAKVLRPDTAVRFFTEAGEIMARLESVAGQTRQRPMPTSAVLRVPREVPPGSPGMFDFPGARFTRTHFHSRACDDLAGAAAALAALDSLRRRRLPIPFAVLLTRAEEVGFVGALAAALDPPARSLLRKRHDLLLAIECSAMQPYAPQGGGVIVRVGDRTSIFNSSLTAFVTEVAAGLAARDATFRYQRALMPGGTCESTVYDAFGFHAAAVCVALGNYHNMNATRTALAPENIAIADYRNMVRLFVELALQAGAYRPGHVALKARLRERFRQNRTLLRG